MPWMRDFERAADKLGCRSDIGAMPTIAQQERARAELEELRARRRHPAVVSKQLTGTVEAHPAEDIGEFETPWRIGSLDAAVRGALRGFLRRIGGAQ